jgi:hypothetical protein
MRDANVTGPRARCALDHARAARISAGVDVCIDDTDHASISRVRGVDALGWLAARNRGDRTEVSCLTGAEPKSACQE